MLEKTLSQEFKTLISDFDLKIMKPIQQEEQCNMLKTDRKLSIVTDSLTRHNDVTKTMKFTCEVMKNLMMDLLDNA